MRTEQQTVDIAARTLREIPGLQIAQDAVIHANPHSGGYPMLVVADGVILGLDIAPCELWQACSEDCLKTIVRHETANLRVPLSSLEIERLSNPIPEGMTKDEARRYWEITRDVIADELKRKLQVDLLTFMDSSDAGIDPAAFKEFLKQLLANELQYTDPHEVAIARARMAVTRIKHYVLLCEGKFDKAEALRLEYQSVPNGASDVPSER